MSTHLTPELREEVFADCDNEALLAIYLESLYCVAGDQVLLQPGRLEFDIQGSRVSGSLSFHAIDNLFDGELGVGHA